MKKKIDLHFDINKEIKISEHRVSRLGQDAELGELYSAMRERWKFEELGVKGISCAASVFYDLGRNHGIREERARRKGVGKA